MQTWPLVGRELELGSMRALLDDPGCAGVVLAGPAGVGKTRLALECLEAADRAGMTHRRVIATRATSELPLGALAPILPARPERDGQWETDLGDMVRQAANAILAGAGAGAARQALLIDDAHLLDPASAAVIHTLVVSRRTFLVVTVRSGTSAPDPVLALWKEGLLERMEIGGLAPADIGALLSAVLDGPVDPAAVRELIRRADGNVLVLRELVDGAVADGSFENVGGVWCLTGELAPSERLVEIVESRLTGLEQDEHDLLELVSFGEPLGPGELSEITGLDRLGDLERRGLIASRLDGQRLEIRLAHPVYGDVLRRRLTALRQREIARRLADAVEARGGRRRQDALRIATWRLSGGGARPESLVDGATIARWRYDFPLAERLARAAVDAGAGFEAELILAQVVSLRGRTSEADRLLLVLGERASRESERARAAIARFDNILMWKGRPDLELIEEEEARTSDPVWRDEIATRRVMALHVMQGHAAAVAAALPILERSRGRTLVVVSLPAAHSLVRVGRISDALKVAERGFVEQQSLQPMELYSWWHQINVALAMNSAGRFAEAETLLSGYYARAIEDGSTEAQAAFAMALTYGVAERGNVEEGGRHAREALALLRQLDRPMIIHSAAIYGSVSFALAGDVQAARATLGLIDEYGVPRAMHSEVERILAEAWIEVAADDPAAARGRLEAAAELAEQIGDLQGEATALHGLARLGRAKEVADRLDGVAARMEGAMAPARARHVRALADDDAERLAAVAGDFEIMGANLLAAEAAADCARVWRRANRPREAATAERTCDRILVSCPGLSTPSLRSRRAPVRLTPTELESARLAAAGRSNKEIAACQGVSVRTVENRLATIYSKLGISGRHDLEHALEAKDTVPS